VEAQLALYTVPRVEAARAAVGSQPEPFRKPRVAGSRSQAQATAVLKPSLRQESTLAATSREACPRRPHRGSTSSVSSSTAPSGVVGGAGGGEAHQLVALHGDHQPVLRRRRRLHGAEPQRGACTSGTSSASAAAGPRTPSARC
jgi:hypothetical protein